MTLPKTGRREGPRTCNTKPKAAAGPRANWGRSLDRGHREQGVVRVRNVVCSDRAGSIRRETRECRFPRGSFRQTTNRFLSAPRRRAHPTGHVQPRDEVDLARRVGSKPYPAAGFSLRLSLAIATKCQLYRQALVKPRAKSPFEASRSRRLSRRTVGFCPQQSLPRRLCRPVPQKQRQSLGHRCPR